MVATLLTNAAESNRGVLRYIPEVTWGTTPGSGVVKTMRITSSSLEAKKTTKVSEEIRADRMVPNIIEVAAMTDGDVGFEFSSGGQDDFYEHFLLAAFSQSMNHFMIKGSTVSVVTTSKIRITGADYTGWLSAGQYLKLEGFDSLFNNGHFHVASFSYTGGNTDIITNETSLVVEAGSAYTKVMDANDVLFKSTTAAIVAGNKISLTGWTTGKGLKAGQKLWLEGLGKESGTIAFNPLAPANNDTFSINDGVNTAITFEFATSSSLASTGHVFVLVTPTSPNTTAQALVTAIQDQFKKHNFQCYAKLTAGTKEAGSIAFATTAEVGDQFTINDGNNATRTFTFVASGAVLGSYNVNVGVSAAASGTNLAAEINFQLAAGTLNVTAAGTSTVTLTNNNYTGGTIVEVVDGGGDITTTNFSGGVKPTVTVYNGYQTGGTITESLASIVGTNFSGGFATKGGLFVTIVSIPDADTVVVSETLTADANGGGLTVVVKGSHLRNPGVATDIVKKSMSMETGFTDVGKYLGHNGLRLSSFTQTIVPGEIVKGKLAFMGRETRALDATELGNTGSYTVLDTTTDEIFNGTSNVDNIARNGSALTTAILKIDINGDAGLRSQPAVGAKFPAGIGYGRFSLKGTFVAYFQNFDLYRDFLNHATSSLSWDMKDLDWNKYFFTIPSIKYTASPLPLDGIDKDVTTTISWTAQRDAALATMFMVDRFSSVWSSTIA